MYEWRNFIMVLLFLVSIVWAPLAFFVLSDEAPLLNVQRTFSALLLGSCAIWVVYALYFEDKLPDNLKEVIGDVYYESDGLSFLPMIRVNQGQAELCVYYQNRYENPVQAIIHMRPPKDGFVIRSGMRDVHFAFKADGGDFGCIHQPIAVPEHLQSDVLDVKLAAATYYPRSHGARLRKHEGMSVGTFLVDWAGAAFKTGVHEISDEIELQNPINIHLAMPLDVQTELSGREVWRQEQLVAGEVATSY
ncbi:MAG: hypothetical protein O7G85_05525 [Planctomycetota bacterium]|nr:hypothetical protein [Planctomycetota bacterium]